MTNIKECAALNKKATHPSNQIVPNKRKKRKSVLHETFILASWYGSGFLAVMGMFAMRDAVTPFPAVGMLLSISWFTLCTMVNCDKGVI